MKAFKKSRRALKERLSYLRRKAIKPSWPKNRDGKILLHIGCGKINSPGFINIDARPLSHIHVVTEDITSLTQFEDNTADLVYMCHILEHIKNSGIIKVLREMKRVLKVGGVLRLSVPDFDRLIEVYDASGKKTDMICRQLMGGQDHQYNIHYSIFNYQSLSELLKEAGFRTIRQWDPDDCLYHDFKDRASRKLKTDGKEHAISLNLEAVK